MKLLRLIVPLALLAGCSHDARRENPLDPELTPAVVLAVTADDTTGTAMLNWTRYEGATDFSSYEVLRNLVDRVEVDTLAVITDVTQTSFIDSAIVANASTGYRVEVVNASGARAGSETRIVSIGDLDAVRILDLQFDAPTATSQMRWSPYVAASFERYEILRRNGGSVPVIVGSTADAADTSFADSGLHGNTQYGYTVAVVTKQGRQLISATQEGGFHPFVDSRDRERTRRLQIDTEGRVEVLSFVNRGKPSDRHAIHGYLGSLDQQGTRLLSAISRNASLAVAATSSGRRFFSVIVGDDGGDGDPGAAYRWDDVQLLEVDAALTPIARRDELFRGSLSSITGELAPEFAGQVSLLGEGPAGTRFFWFDDILISSSDSTLLQDPVEGEAGPLGWTFPLGTDTVTRGFPAYPSSWRPLGSSLSTSNKAMSIAVAGQADTLLKLATVTDPSWNITQVGTDVALNIGTRGGIQLGTEQEGTARLLLTLDNDNDLARLEWRHRSGGRDESRILAEMPHIVTTYGLYRLGLRLEGDQLEAWIESDPLWGTQSSTRVPLWSSMIAVGEELALTSGDRRYLLSTEGELLSESELESPVSETRLWTDPQSGRDMAGYCLPELDQLKIRVFHRTRGAWVWPTAAGAITIGGRGSSDGRLSYPISFDVGPDGRIYVLDAGNSRVQVFSSDGSYLTQWGHRGTEDGAFDFGELPVGEVSDIVLAGSIAVDDDGFVYVGDQTRIQKFAP